MFLGIDYRLWFIVILNFVVLSNIVTKALTKKEWTDAMKAEMDSWEKNSTREIVDKHKEKNIVHCKRILTVKYKADGSIERYKVRLVTEGYCKDSFVLICPL